MRSQLSLLHTIALAAVCLSLLESQPARSEDQVPSLQQGLIDTPLIVPLGLEDLVALPTNPGLVGSSVANGASLPIPDLALPQAVDNVFQIKSLVDSATKLNDLDVWEGSSLQKRYGRILHTFEPSLSSGQISNSNANFLEQMQASLRANLGISFHVIGDDTKQDIATLYEPPPAEIPAAKNPPDEKPGPLVLIDGKNGGAVPVDPPYYSDKAGFLPGVGIIVQKEFLAPVDGGWSLATTDMNLSFNGVKYPPCPVADSFVYKSRDKPRVDGRVCTGFLLGAADNLVTARHCLHDVSKSIPAEIETKPWLASVRADQYAVVFGFKYLKDVDGNYLAVYPNEHVYFFSVAAASPRIAQSDIVELRLDRPVPNDVAAPFEMDARPLDDALRPLHFLIAGFAQGLPMNIDMGRPQISQISEQYFGTFYVGVDNYGGDSGAPVFDAASGKVVGLMRSGKNDFSLSEMPPGNSCYVSDVTQSLADSQETALHLKTFFQ